MADDKSKRGAADRSRINIHEPYEVKYWTKTLGVNSEKLMELVKEHGTSAEAVRNAVKGKGKAASA